MVIRYGPEDTSSTKSSLKTHKRYDHRTKHVRFGSQPPEELLDNEFGEKKEDKAKIVVFDPKSGYYRRISATGGTGSSDHAHIMSQKLDLALKKRIDSAWNYCSKESIKPDFNIRRRRGFRKALYNFNYKFPTEEEVEAGVKEWKAKQEARSKRSGFSGENVYHTPMSTKVACRALLMQAHGEDDADFHREAKIFERKEGETPWASYLRLLASDRTDKSENIDDLLSSPSQRPRRIDALQAWEEPAQRITYVSDRNDPLYIEEPVSASYFMRRTGVLGSSSGLGSADLALPSILKRGGRRSGIDTSDIYDSEPDLTESRHRSRKPHHQLSSMRPHYTNVYAPASETVHDGVIPDYTALPDIDLDDLPEPNYRPKFKRWGQYDPDLDDPEYEYNPNSLYTYVRRRINVANSLSEPASPKGRKPVIYSVPQNQEEIIDLPTLGKYYSTRSFDQMVPRHVIGEQPEGRRRKRFSRFLGRRHVPEEEIY